MLSRKLEEISIAIYSQIACPINEFETNIQELTNQLNTLVDKIQDKEEALKVAVGALESVTLMEKIGSAIPLAESALKKIREITGGDSE